MRKDVRRRVELSPAAHSGERRESLRDFGGKKWAVGSSAGAHTVGVVLGIAVGVAGGVVDTVVVSIVEVAVASREGVAAHSSRVAADSHGHESDDTALGRTVQAGVDCRFGRWTTDTVYCVHSPEHSAEEDG